MTSTRESIKRLVYNSVLFISLWIFSNSWEFDTWWLRLILSILVWNIVTSIWNILGWCLLWNRRDINQSDIINIKKGTPIHSNENSIVSSRSTPSRTPIPTPTMLYSSEKPKITPQQQTPKSPLEKRHINIQLSPSLSRRSLASYSPFQAAPIKYWTVEDTCKEYHISSVEFSESISRLKNWIVTRLLRPFLQNIAQMDIQLENIGINDASFAQSNSISTHPQYQSILSQLGQDWISRHIAVEDWLRIPYYDQDSGFTISWVLDRISDIARFTNMSTFEQTSEGESQPPACDTEILMHLFCCYMDTLLPKEASFRQSIYVVDQHSHTDDKSPFSSFLWLYPVIIKRIQSTGTDSSRIRYQVMTNSKIVFVGEEPLTRHHFKVHWFHAIWFLVLFIQREYSGYLGSVYLGTKLIDLLSIFPTKRTE